MYTKYYIETTDKEVTEWVVRKEINDEIIGNFRSKELALQFVYNLCKDNSQCSIVVSDKSIYTISLDDIKPQT